MSKTIETIVWSKMQCPYCDMAKALLKQKNIEFEERKIGNLSNFAEDPARAGNPTGSGPAQLRAVYQLFIDCV